MAPQMPSMRTVRDTATTVPLCHDGYHISRCFLAGRQRAMPTKYLVDMAQ